MTRPFSSKHSDPKVAEAVNALLKTLEGQQQNLDLIGAMLDTITSLPSLHMDRGETKIMRSTLIDFANAFEVFSQYRDKPKVSIFGSARTPKDSPLYQHCKDFAKALVDAGFMVITGAGPGIMQAGNEGATREQSFGVNINLPFEQSSNPFIDGDPKCINFKYFFTRKLTFVKESHAVVLFPGGMGTMDEGFETLTLIQTGKRNPIPLVLLDIPGSNYWIEWEMFVRDVLLKNGLISSDDFNLFRYTTSIDKAIEDIQLFYRNYHSLRYVGDEVILRLKRAPTEHLLATLNKRYAKLLKQGQFEKMDEPHFAEQNESEDIKNLHRIRFCFIQRRFGSLRRLIDTINLTDLE